MKSFSPTIIGTMARKRDPSKETDDISIREVVEKIPVDLRVYVDT